MSSDPCNKALVYAHWFNYWEWDLVNALKVHTKEILDKLNEGKFNETSWYLQTCYQKLIYHKIIYKTFVYN